MAVVDPMATLLTVCEHGHGKRTSFDEYRLTGRGAGGVINIHTTERNGKVVAVKAMRDADELMLITQNGKIVRTGLGDMRVIGRATQGVRIITMKSGDKLVSVARVVSEDNTQGTLRLEPGEGEDEPELFPRASGLADQEEEEVEEQGQEQDEPREQDEPEQAEGDDADPLAPRAKAGPKKPARKKPSPKPPAAGGEDEDTSML
jgi:hypothetical protein